MLIEIIYCTLMYESCLAVMPSLGRGQISVELTGHARFLVENYKTYFRKYELFSKEINWIKGGLFLFILSLVVKPFLTNSQRFLN